MGKKWGLLSRSVPSFDEKKQVVVAFVVHIGAGRSSSSCIVVNVATFRSRKPWTL